MITIEEIKKHCRIDSDDCCDEAMLIRYLDAAKQHASNYIDLPVFESEIEKGDKDGVVVTEAIEQAILMLIGHFYENREAVSDVQLLESPLSVKWMLNPYRKMGV